MMNNLWGNPHSENTPARSSGDMVDRVRAQTLAFFGADPAHFDLVFVANATAAIKLVAEAFRDLGEAATSTRTGERGGFWYGYHGEVHTSVVGVRELAGDDFLCLEHDSDVDSWLSSSGQEDGGAAAAAAGGKHDPLSKRIRLFAYPGQSNMTGRRLPREWPRRVREKNENHHLQSVYTLLDAAALAMTSDLSPLFADPDAAPDFTCLSLYKIFGFPDLGALIVRRASGRTLNARKYYGGGTIGQVFPFSNKKGSTVKKMPGSGSGAGEEDYSWQLHEGMEDGTVPFHSILALGLAIETHQRLYGSMASPLPPPSNPPHSHLDCPVRFLTSLVTYLL
jgi:molybdenum cofactor sulfurtransferase